MTDSEGILTDKGLTNCQMPAAVTGDKVSCVGVKE